MKQISIISREELSLQERYMQTVRDKLAERYAAGEPPLAFVHSYGCQQNVSDGEKIKGMLAQMGYGFTDSLDRADLVLYNTCAVRENAEDRVFGNVGELKRRKKANRSMLIGLCGCMPQQEYITERIRKSYPYVDLVFGTHVLHRLPELLNEALGDGKRHRVFEISQSDGVIAEGLPVVRSDPYKASISIMYGCNNFCSFCIVPYVRGRERSREFRAILAEAEQLVRQGYKEILLLGQNVNSYKGDDGENFADLLRAINAINEDFRIRFMTSHPKDASRELIETIAECEKVCRHLHLPVQSGSDRVLKAMNRGYTAEKYLDFIEYARQKIPDLAFTSDIIIGFPTETREEAQETIDLIRKVRYHNLFTFIYSKRLGTKAAEIEDDTPYEEKIQWFTELLRVQEAIGEELLEAYIGKTLRVLVDSEGRRGEGTVNGRTEQNVIVDFKGDDGLIGQFVDVKITEARHSALRGELV